MPNRNNRKKTISVSVIVFGIAMTASLLTEGGSAMAATDTFWLSAMPPQMSHGGGAHGQATGKPGSNASHGQASANSGGQGRPGGHASGEHGGHESEHRPKPMRTYYLDTCGISDKAEAFVTRPEGEFKALDIERKEHEVKVTVPTPMGEGLAHGANNVYLVDRRVENGTLVVFTAKWLTIHHNCGWGHDHKFDPARQVSHPFDKAPLEIVVNDLWDFNFHSNVMSGDTISFQILSFGQPVSGATVVVESEKGWQKRVRTDEEGRASFQLVRDYYPDSWENFDRTKIGTMHLTARYETDEAGEYEGKGYDRTKMTSTFAWRYYPARQEYASYNAGMFVGLLGMTVSGGSVFYFRQRRRKVFARRTFHE